MRLWRQFLVQAFIRDTHYRMHFFSTVIVGIVQLISALVPIWLLFGYTDSVRGWDRSAVVALMGLYQIVTGLLAAFLAPNLSRMTAYISKGELDIVLVRPVSAQFYVTFRWIDLAELGNVLTGAVILGIGLSHSDGGLGPAGIVQSIVLAGSGLVLLGCAWTALALLAFWMQSVEPIAGLFMAALETGKYPITFFPAGVRAALIFAFPVAFATTFPTEALTGGIGWLPVAGGVLLGVMAVAAVRSLWRVGIRTYASASS
ncbi:MAG TPA: ABC-2 family transporter protein [Mycobacteriales bacterium]|nr:ABC-2 family transporter protein [Mycobacteriales bacterium]